MERFHKNHSCSYDVKKGYICPEIDTVYPMCDAGPWLGVPTPYKQRGGGPAPILGSETKDKKIYSESRLTKDYHEVKKYLGEIISGDKQNTSNRENETHGFYYDISEPKIGGRQVHGSHNNYTVPPRIMYRDVTSFQNKKFDCNQPKWCNKCL